MSTARRALVLRETAFLADSQSSAKDIGSMSANLGVLPSRSQPAIDAP